MYREIFDEIASIMHHDYAGCLDKKGWDSPDEYKSRIQELEAQGLLNAQAFVEIVQEYLCDFKDHHMFFKLASTGPVKRKYVGFKVRRYGDLLYIYEASAEPRVQKGMAIRALDEWSIPELAERHKKLIQEDKHERQMWASILLKYQTCEVVDRHGQTFQLDVQQYDVEDYVPEYSFDQLTDTTAYIKLTDFMDVDAVGQLLRDHAAEINHCVNLIVDVRLNRGGSDSAYFELLPYMVDNDCTLEELAGSDDGQQFNCTVENYENKVKPLIVEREHIEDKATRDLLGVFITEWEKNHGRGFVEFDLSSLAGEISFKASARPERVFVLSDVFCGSSGDAFVEVSKKSKKVTVIGRATQGITDYSNLATKTWGDEFELWYPTSRSSKIDRGQGLTGVGVLPDVYIPWTPEHIFEDMDLKAALALC